MVSGRWIETGADLWKDRARSLQLRLRDRLRVAVDHHRRRPKIYDGYLSSTVERWIQRFSDFRRDTLPSSSTFYRKKGQLPFPRCCNIASSLVHRKSKRRKR